MIQITFPMRTIIVFLCCALSTSVAFSQNINTSDLNSVHRLSREGPGEDDFFSGQIHEDLTHSPLLSDDDRIDSLYYWTWDTILLQWQVLTRNYYTSDENNNVLTQLTMAWDGAQWLNQIFNTYTFDQYNNLVNDIEQIWNGTSWYNNT